MKNKELNTWIASHVEAMVTTVGFGNRHPLQLQLEEMLLAEIKNVVVSKVDEAAAVRLADQVLVRARRDLRNRGNSNNDDKSTEGPEKE